MVAQQAVILPAPPQPTDQWSRDYANQLYRWMESFQRQVTGFPYLRGSGLFFPENALPTAEAGLVPGTVFVGGGALLVAGGGGSVNNTLAALADLTMAADQGIYFTDPDTAAAFTFEPGTWTPTISFGGASVGITYDASVTAGRYLRIGPFVLVQGRVALTSKGSSTGSFGMAGWPATTISVPNPIAIARTTGFTGLTGALKMYIFGGNWVMRQTVATGETTINDTHFTDTADFSFAGVYFSG